MLQLVAVVVVVLFAVPALLYWVALASRRYIKRAPGWIGMPIDRKPPSGKIEPEPPPEV